MKKNIIKFAIVFSVFFLFSVPSVFSQKIDEADIYYVNVKIVKIFPHHKGLYVVYRRAGAKLGEAFIPYKWFEPADGRGKLQYINTMVNPYMSFFIRDGKFEFVKVSAPNYAGDPTWGILKEPREFDDKFEGVETLELQF